MRTNRQTGTVTLSQPETRVWRRAEGPAAKGRDLGARWNMKRVLWAICEALVMDGDPPVARVVACDGEVVATYDPAAEAKKRAVKPMARR